MIKKKKTKKIPKIKKPRKPSISSLKKKAWKLCSEYIRRKYSSKTGMLKCYCGQILHWKKAQASHLVGGRTNKILFDERGIYPSCYQCNIPKHGNIPVYIQFLENRLGTEEAKKLRDDLIIASKQTLKFTVFDLEILIVKYKKLLEELTKEGR